MWSQLSAELRELIGKEAALGTFREQLAAQLGAEREVLEERTDSQSGRREYERTVLFERSAEPFVVRLTFNPEGVILGFTITPAKKPEPAPSSYLNYSTKAPLRLPFTGTWTVFWGGRTVEENYHAVNGAQRFAYDFLVMEGDSSHRGEGRLNSDYFCYGKPIVAPADGVVVTAVNDVPDNVPGELNNRQVAGNHVILDHGNDEFSFLAHLIPGSVSVSVGTTVRSGQLLGRCGNSGRSSEPHLHYHMQNSADLERGEGLPAIFNAYVADGRPVDRGEPVRAQRVRPLLDDAEAAE